jgi:hypothetical protein
MKTLLTFAAAGLFALSTVATASACGYGQGKTAEISKPVTTAEAPIMTPTPKPEG